MTRGLVLAAMAVTAGFGYGGFFYSETADAALAPVSLSGRMSVDFRTHALTAKVCVADKMPSQNILQSWRKLGVKMLRRAAWDPEVSAEYFRRKCGFLAFHEGADGVWLEGEKNFSESWRAALAEAKTDIAVAQYLQELGKEALASKDHRLVLEGRRVQWLFEHLKYESVDLDCLRLEFVAYAKFLEGAMGKKAKALPIVPAAAFKTPYEKFTPWGIANVNGDLPRVAVTTGKPVELAKGFSFKADFTGFSVTVCGKGGPKEGYPGGQYRLKLYLPGDGKGGNQYIPYEYKIDLSPLAPGRAPFQNAGYFVSERFGDGCLSQYSRPNPWRCEPVPRRSPSPENPELVSQLKFARDKQGEGWSFSVSFGWQDLYGHWPMCRKGVREAWYIGIDHLPGGSEPVRMRLNWPTGNENNFKSFAERLACRSLSETYGAQLTETEDMFTRYFSERLYVPIEAPMPTFQRFGKEDRMFFERCLKPMLEANANAYEMIYEAAKTPPAKIHKQVDAVKLKIWQSLGRLLNLEHAALVARRDYLALRLAGKEPPVPAAKKSQKKVSLNEPDVSFDEGIMDLDDKEF